MKIEEIIKELNYLKDIAKKIEAISTKFETFYNRVKKIEDKLNDESIKGIVKDELKKIELIHGVVLNKDNLTPIEEVEIHFKPSDENGADCEYTSSFTDSRGKWSKILVLEEELKIIPKKYGWKFYPEEATIKLGSNRQKNKAFEFNLLAEESSSV